MEKSIVIKVEYTDFIKKFEIGFTIGLIELILENPIQIFKVNLKLSDITLTADDFDVNPYDPMETPKFYKSIIIKDNDSLEVSEAENILSIRLWVKKE
jgi:hypothetical protein